jgi:hypothetical protein
MSGWKKEIRGQTEYKLAVDLLAALYRFRDAIDSTRNPMIFAGEMFEDAGDNYNRFDEKQRFEGITRAYQKRWDRVIDSKQSIYANLILAEVVWGEEIKNPFQELFVRSEFLRSSIENHLKSINPASSKIFREASKEQTQKRNNILYKNFEIDSSSNVKDSFNDKLKELVTEIETFLKPKLKS